MPFSITKLGHVEMRVTDMNAARAFYVDALGLVETDHDSERIYLRGLEERSHHSVVLRKSKSGGLGHFGLRVSDSADVDRLRSFYASIGAPASSASRSQERGLGKCLRVQVPGALPVEFYGEVDEAERLLDKPQLYRGSHPLRIDHVNFHVSDLDTASKHFSENLGFYTSEYAENESGVWAAFLHRKQNTHDVALFKGKGPRLHHFAIWVNNLSDIARTCDILSGMRMADRIEYGPGHHGATNANFVYLRDPDDNRVEIFTGDYLIPDPDWKPIRWGGKWGTNIEFTTMWNQAPPKSWLNEASPVESVMTGELLESVEPKDGTTLPTADMH